MSLPPQWQQSEAAAEAEVVAFLQFLMFVCGTSVGSFAYGWTLTAPIILVSGLVFPLARVWAEKRVRPSVPVGEGELPFRHRGTVAALVAIGAATYFGFRPGELCSTLILAPIIGLAVDNLMTALVLVSRQIRRRRSVRGWTRLDVVSVHEGIATLRLQGDFLLAHHDGDLSLGIVYADLDLYPADYRLSAAARIHDFESEETRRGHRALAKLAAIRLCSGLMWIAIAVSPHLGEAFGERIR